MEAQCSRCDPIKAKYRRTCTSERVNQYHIDLFSFEITLISKLPYIEFPSNHPGISHTDCNSVRYLDILDVQIIF